MTKRSRGRCPADSRLGPRLLPKQTKEKQTRERCGFTILELLTVVAVIAILLGVVLPAIGAAWEAARKIQCVNDLKQIGIALHNYHDVCRCLPSGWQWEQTNQSVYGWGVPLLPHLEQPAIGGPNCETCDECEFDSRHPGGVNFLWGDGRVQFVSDDVDSETYQSMSRRFAPHPRIAALQTP